MARFKSTKAGKAPKSVINMWKSHFLSNTTTFTIVIQILVHTSKSTKPSN